MSGSIYASKNKRSKICSGLCGQRKPLTEFHKDGSKSNGRMSRCKKCVVNKNRASHLRKTYGITVEVYDNFLLIQGNACGICKGPCSTGKRLCVDHCHKTGKIRGLLCSNCNRALGKFLDDAQLLRQAIDYLEGIK